jgi:mannose-6-phosphate isomerase-like protein (cupin superfamily)
MSEPGGPRGLVDAVQIFDAAKAVDAGAAMLASANNSNVSVLRIGAGGDAEIDPQRLDQILVVLEGEGTIQTPTNTVSLKPRQGVLVPAGTQGRLTNTAGGQLVFFCMGASRPSVPPLTPPSEVLIKIPAADVEVKSGWLVHSPEIKDQGNLCVYTIDRATLGVSPLIMEEWNQVSILRTTCRYVREGDQLVSRLPDRIVRWYRLEGLSDGDYVVRGDNTRTRVRVDLRPFFERQARARTQ